MKNQNEKPMLKALQTFLNLNKIYKPNELKEILKEVRPYFRFAYCNTKQKYFNVPCSFDIETSSFYQGEKKCAIMYEWTFGIFGLVMIGRTWGEFKNMISELSEILDLKDHKRLIIYVHNLSYEFQFIRKHFEWLKVFAIDNRKPIYALTTEYIEFRCSYLLSGYSLAKLGEELRIFEIKKLIGFLDYEKIRHYKTELTEKEVSYCVNDVKVVMAYIAETMETDGNIARIPLTKTGYVRTYCRNSCFYEEGISRKKSFKRLRYREIIKNLTIEVDEYKLLKNGFQGGFTHANPFYSGKIVNNVTSYDFTSSYPSVMIAEKFPMSKGKFITVKTVSDFKKNLKLYCCLFEVYFEGLRSKVLYENYLSVSRCRMVKKAIVNNGRVVSAESLYTTITEQDYLIISKMYEWDKIKIGEFIRYKKDYLPTDFVKAILKLYEDKTTLKGVEGKEVEYMLSKNMLNSCYGMAVTDIVRDEYIYTDEWQEPKTPDFEEALKKYNCNSGRFLFYPWGVWVTAYARRNLFTGILEFKNDYVYSDTDSIKVINAEKHKSYIETYNQVVMYQLKKAADFHGIPYEAIEPKTIKGVKKPLGVWDFDGKYSRFKTVGAKRYIVEYEDTKKINITVAGLNKFVAVPYMLEKYGKDIFDVFNDELYIPPEYTGKNTHTYIDEIRNGVVTDYKGYTVEFEELSSVHLEKADYSLSLAREYVNYLLSLETEIL